MKKIQIDIKKDGTIDIEAIGYKGVGCEEATRVFEEALGTVTSRDKKPEFYQKEQEHINETNRNQ